MELVPDYTLVVQIVLFVVLWMGLKRLLFEPVLGVLEEREARTRGRERQAREGKARAVEAQGHYEEAIREARVKVAREGEAAEKAAWEEHARAVAAAREKAVEEIARSRRELVVAVEEAGGKLGVEAEKIAEEMVERVTGRLGA
jgi:F-type H+-transporting ATPase subunit b